MEPKKWRCQGWVGWRCYSQPCGAGPWTSHGNRLHVAGRLGHIHPPHSAGTFTSSGAPTALLSYLNFSQSSCPDPSISWCGQCVFRWSLFQMWYGTIICPFIFFMGFSSSSWQLKRSLLSVQVIQVLSLVGMVATVGPGDLSAGCPTIS